MKRPLSGRPSRREAPIQKGGAGLMRTMYRDSFLDFCMAMVFSKAGSSQDCQEAVEGSNAAGEIRTLGSGIPYFLAKISWESYSMSLSPVPSSVDWMQ